LRGTLPAGTQANHINLNAVYKEIIPEDEGLSVGMKGNIFTDKGSPHRLFHESLEQFWDQFRPGGSREWEKPTHAEVGEAGRRAFIYSGFSPEQASDLAGQGAAQRAAFRISETARVREIPKAIFRRRR
jgi:hypothetical protein